jgi:hypothetical protein
MKQWAEQFYNGKAWHDCRAAYMLSVGGLCERCAVRDEIVAADIIHHREYITRETVTRPEVTLNFTNLEALCQRCHNEEHHGNRSGGSGQRYAFNERGEIVAATMPPLQKAKTKFSTPSRGNKKTPQGRA